MVKLSFAIMHAPWNETRRINLLKIIKALGGQAAIQSATESFEVARDGGWHEPRRTALLAWQSMAPTATHCLVIQDDVYPCARFFDAVKHLVSLAPDRALSLFSQKNSLMTQAQEQGRAWMRGNAGTITAQALLFPRILLEDMLLWQEAHVRSDYPHDDGVYNLYFDAHQLRIWYPVPTLVQHMNPRGSVMKHENKFWSNHFLAQRDFAEIDWTAGLDDPLKIYQGLTVRCKAALVEAANG